MSVAETTATAANTLCKVPTLGLETTFQLVPFHCSVSVWLTPAEGEGMENPTAQMSLAETVATPFSWFEPAPALGLATMFRRGPSPVPRGPPPPRVVWTPL